MANDDKRQPQGSNSAEDEALHALARSAEQTAELTDQERESLQGLAADPEAAGLQDQILSRYQDIGRDLLADASPRPLDPRIIASLKPILGDVSHVRVHTGKLATEAARVMDARAFAIGDKDIFVDQALYDPNSMGGRSLIAHEVAHTVDAATGFALSSRQGGPGRSDRERFADSAAAQHEQNERGGGSEEGGGGTDAGAGGDKKMPKVPKHKLARLVAEVIAKQSRRALDRTGGAFGNGTPQG